ncbi:FHA domain-containing protein [Enterobacillus tribolii]|uniref:FHA domain-containing protein n=2 Tax=Enterobacillus tribolii TaxID=1487935 RepID=A0A370QS65_9GAMM|nr:type VI secretion system-associated FHA domain protein TagH [Enterobacillus tribolii]RDK92099.1 FHA domain-containing protein [Enterobacillus tribolii]
MRLTMIRNRDNERIPQSYCDFTAPGGTIGRGTDNTLILPDQTRAISRLQAIIHLSQGGEAFITHRGSTTPLILNGKELAHDVQQPLAEGDILDIAGYRFKVDMNISPDLAAAMPVAEIKTDGAGIDDAVWADLEAEFPPRVSPRHRPSLHDPEHPLFSALQDNRQRNDPLAMEQEADLDSLNNSSTDPEHLFSQEDPFARQTIMKDTTPTVLFTRPDAAPEAEAEEEEMSPGLIPHGAENHGQQFNPAEVLSTVQEPELKIGGDDDDDDPLGLFLDNAVPLASSMDDVAFLPPEPEIPPPAAAPSPAAKRPPAAVVPPPPPPPPPLPETSPVDIAWTEPPRAEPSPLDPLTSFEDMPFGAPVAPQEETSAAAAMRLGIDPVKHQPYKPPESASGEHLNGELFNAFVAGLGLDDAPVQPVFSPEQLFLAGKLLSLFSQGTVALLSSRSILKRGLKAEMTVILEEENNPFKMLPSGKTVLMQIFSTPMPGFIPPESAVRNALIDLQAHQLGMIAGVRAIIAAMLQTFHPDELEKMAAERGDLPNKGLFSGNRKAMLWDMLKIHYQRVANEVEDDFHTLFGEAFLHAYDLEIRQYKASQGPKGA